MKYSSSCGLVLEGGAVDALELRVLFVALVVGAGDVGELERADVAGAHDVRPGAEIGEIAVAIERDFFALGNVLDDIELELARVPGRSPRAPSRHACAIASASSRETIDPLEDVVRFDLLFHLRLDLREILGRDAVRQIDVVIEAVLHRRPGGELRLRPDAQDGRRQHVRGGMAQPLEVGHGQTFMCRRQIGGSDVFGD